jgi:hypothetical protein
VGFVPPTTGVKLEFEGTLYEGLEVTMDEVATGTVLDIMELFEEAKNGDVKAFKILLADFSAALESWNIDHPKTLEPVPATLEGLRTLGFTLSMAIIGGWVGTVTSAPPPLPGGSASGGISREEATTLAGLSSSLPS